MVLGTMGVKAAAAVSLTGASYLSGTLPCCLGLGRKGSAAQSLLLSLILCAGGGVLFATAVIHVLPEARTALPSWADLVFCLGFMVLYIIDELIKICELRNSDASCKLEVDGLLYRTVHHRYDSVCEHEHNDNHDEEQGDHEGSTEYKMSAKVSVKGKSAVGSRVGLLLAFSIHSVIEGLVIGVQPVPAKVLLLVAAVSSHKLVVAFCLGVELASDGRSFLSLSQSMLIYSLGSSVGILLGVLLEEWKDYTTNISIPVLQALAAGSLLYVTVSEVLPRERSRWEHQTVHSCAGLAQFFSFTFGFSIIAAIVTFT